MNTSINQQHVGNRASTFSALIIAILYSFFGAHLNYGILFPQQTAPYDPDHGAVTCPDAWNDGHAIVFLWPGDAPAVAVHPNWVITVSHWPPNFTHVRVPGVGYFPIVDRVMAPNGADARLYRVNSNLSVYSQYRATQVAVSEQIVVYGRGAGAGDPVTDASGNILGWKNGTSDYILPRGNGVVSESYSSALTWPFTSSVTDCAMGSYFDSGGGVFVGSYLVGLNRSVATRQASPDANTPCVTANVFDMTGLYTCGSYQLVSQTTATPIFSISDWIDNTLAAPVVSIQGYYSASEPSSTGGYMLSRTGSTAQALTVYVYGVTAYSGDAQPGSDYEGYESASAAIIPAGHSSYTFPIEPIDDYYPEGQETVRLRLYIQDSTSNRTYTIGTPEGTIQLSDDE